ncbi:MAG: TM1266 family iron-only hydrogenase system putative regulator [Peptococcaceae bacterium]|nr:TM1266 family iron-only hydrogenase system putative regulator [Peptococcaceae bacterium]
MDTRVATLGIIVDQSADTEALNAILHDFRDYIVGRMGIPYRQKNMNIICLVVDAPQDEINSLTGKIGSLDGIAAKACYSQV